jgi:hypothetical protein
VVCHDVYQVSGLSRDVERVLIEIEEGAELERQAILEEDRPQNHRPPLQFGVFLATGALDAK